MHYWCHGQSKRVLRNKIESESVEYKGVGLCKIPRDRNARFFWTQYGTVRQWRKTALARKLFQRCVWLYLSKIELLFTTVIFTGRLSFKAWSEIFYLFSCVTVIKAKSNERKIPTVLETLGFYDDYSEWCVNNHGRQ